MLQSSCVPFYQHQRLAQRILSMPLIRLLIEKSHYQAKYHLLRLWIMAGRVMEASLNPELCLLARSWHQMKSQGWSAVGVRFQIAKEATVNVWKLVAQAAALVRQDLCGSIHFRINQVTSELNMETTMAIGMIRMNRMTMVVMIMIMLLLLR